MTPPLDKQILTEERLQLLSLNYLLGEHEDGNFEMYVARF